MPASTPGPRVVRINSNSTPGKTGDGAAGLAAILERQAGGRSGESLSPANYLHLATESQSFERLTAYQYWTTSPTGGGQPEALQGIRVTAVFFPTSGVKPALNNSG